MLNAFLAAILAITASAADPAKAKTEISQDITVHARASAPALAVPAPTPSKPIVDEVLNSIPLGRHAGAAKPDTVHTTPPAPLPH